MEFARLMVDAVSALIWPAILVLVFLKLLPDVKKRLEAGGFTLKIGGNELTVQEANQQLTKQIEDLTNRVTALSDAQEARSARTVDGGRTEAVGLLERERVEEPAGKTSRLPQKVLWVDDEPKNNAFETASLERRGVEVVSVTSTEEARAVLAGDSDIEAVITDMHRIEGGVERPRAGIDLGAWIRQHHPVLPVLLYCGPYSLDAFADEIETIFTAGTASPSRLQADLRLDRLVVLEIQRLFVASDLEVAVEGDAGYDLRVNVEGHDILVEAQVGNVQTTRPRSDVVDRLVQARASIEGARVWIVFFRFGNRSTPVDAGENVTAMHLSLVPAQLAALQEQRGLPGRGSVGRSSR